MAMNRRGLMKRGIGLMGATLAGVSPSAAQRSVKPVKDTPTPNPYRFADTLPHLDWNVARRGALLIVSPDEGTLQGKLDVMRSGMPPHTVITRVGEEQIIAGWNGFNLARIAQAYGRRLTRIGTISVVTTDTMAVLRYRNLPEPDLLSEADSSRRVAFLLATLSPEQWSVLQTPEGLGAATLRTDQNALFAALLPKGTDVCQPGSRSVEVTDAHRATLRLRLLQEGMGQAIGTDAGGMYLSRPAPPNLSPYDHLTDTERAEITVPISFFGVPVLEMEPNRAKPSDIDGLLPEWDAPVAIHGAVTVGDLLARASAATERKIIADPRYALLRVYFRVAPDSRVRSGDLLRAVALSVTGTYRRVAFGANAVFLLTDDRVGLGARLAAIGQWKENAQKRSREIYGRGTTPGANLVPAPGAIALLLPGVGTIGKVVRVSSAGQETPQKFDTDMVWSINRQLPPDTKATLPVRVARDLFVERVLAVTVHSDAEARNATRIAWSRHFTQIVVSVGSESAQTVAGWFAAIRKETPGLAVWLRTSLFRATVEGGTALLDRNIFGETFHESLRRGRGLRDAGFESVLWDTQSETGDYLSVGEAGATQAIAARLSALAEVAPGLAGMLFTDATPPGYDAGQDGVLWRLRRDRELGYHAQNRIAFMEESGRDPVDLSPVGDLSGSVPGFAPGDLDRRVVLPRFPEEGNPEPFGYVSYREREKSAKQIHEQWDDFRVRQLRETRDTLHGSLRKKHPALPLFFQHIGTWEGFREWLPSAQDTAETNAPLTWQPFTYTPRTPVGVAIPPAERVARQFAATFAWLSAPTKPETEAYLKNRKLALFFDLTQAPLAEVDDLLSQIVFAP